MSRSELARLLRQRRQLLEQGFALGYDRASQHLKLQKLEREIRQVEDRGARVYLDCIGPCDKSIV